MRFWNWIKLMISGFWAWIKWLTGEIWKPLALLLILLAVWIGFLKLVSPPPIETTPVIIMLWITAAILLLALFPSVLDLIKKIKIGDIEIELKDVISKSSPQDYIIANDISGTSIYHQKGGAKDLQVILTKLMQDVDKPILLTVNLERSISKTFLFVYIFLIELYSSSIVFFVAKKPQLKNITDLKENEVLGIISGQRLINSYLRRFPSLLRIFSVRSNMFGDDVYEPAGLVQIPSGEIIETLYNLCENQIRNDLEREIRNDLGRENRFELLSRQEVENWLKDKLSSKSIEKSFDKDDLETLRQCIVNGDEFIILTENKKIISITKVETLTRSISKNLLTQITRNK